MTERTFTAAEMRARAAERQASADRFTELVGHGFVNVHATDAVMLRQAADAESRWAELKAWAESFGLEANDLQAFRAVVARLEGELP